MKMVKVIDTNSILRYFKGIVPDKHFLLYDALERFQSTNLSIVDALVWATARENGWTVRSFDEGLNELVKCRTQPD
jgi:predicted nucleic acid-binding protein